MVHEFLTGIPLHAYREHGAFGAEVSVASGEPVGDRLLGLVGRQPS